MNTGHNGADIAMNWMFEHMEDPDIDDPLPATSSNTASAGPSEDQISTLQEMGFSAQQAKKALHETVSTDMSHGGCFTNSLTQNTVEQ